MQHNTPALFRSQLKSNMIWPGMHIINSRIMQKRDTGRRCPPIGGGIMECPAHIQHTITLMTLPRCGLVILHENEDIHHGN